MQLIFGLAKYAEFQLADNILHLIYNQENDKQKYYYFIFTLIYLKQNNKQIHRSNRLY